MEDMRGGLEEKGEYKPDDKKSEEASDCVLTETVSEERIPEEAEDVSAGKKTEETENALEERIPEEAANSTVRINETKPAETRRTTGTTRITGTAITTRIIRTVRTVRTFYDRIAAEKTILLKDVLRLLIFPICCIYLEFVFHLMVFHKLDGNIIYPLIFAVFFGCLIELTTIAFSRRINLILSWVMMSIVCLSFIVQLVYQHIFKTFLSVYSIGENGGDVMEFWKDALNGVWEVFPGILMLCVPLFLLGFAIKKKISFERKQPKWLLVPLGTAYLIYLIGILVLRIPGKEAFSPYDLYYNGTVMELVAEKLGLLTSVQTDFREVFAGEKELTLSDEAFMEVLVPVESKEATPSVVPTVVPVSQGALTKAATPIPEPTEVPVDRSPNVLNIDFEKLASEEKNDTVNTLHNYFSLEEPTKKNEYTGMFEGYNLIFLTAEGFSPWAVDPEVTPTLYRLVNEGFVFKNFYTPIWYTSTSDGEYVACTGLIPSGTNSFSKSGEHALPFCLGWQFGKLSYSARAYHNHSYTYYNRHITHPNMGYEYKGAKGGLEIKETWPESDLEMMQVTIPEYIQDDKFHVYYMTVSGHLQYTFTGNYIARKNKEYVDELPYSDNVKAYIASQKELDLALEYLIQELKEAGVLEHTVIALSADHYPYGLTNEEISEAAGHTIEENFELYKNHFILWNSAMEEPVIVEKYCSSLDIMPTLCNLFAIPYDSRLFMGQDILSDSKALVMFSNQSFITDEIMYNSKNREITKLTEQEIPEDYVKKYISIVKNKFNVSGSILKTDYFSYLLPYLGDKEICP